MRVAANVLASPQITISQMIGVSPCFQAALNLIRKFAECDATVLIRGETGTGKELAAQAIHYLGPRRDHPFVPVNCGALPDSLLESEFFGHVRGAFTDASESKAGLVALADGGTLFLDEVECLSLKGQVVLLRFLQDQVYRPIGGRQLYAGNVRVIAASNANIAELVTAGTFRQDLMYRLSIMSLRMPTLRERQEDIILLADHFVRRYARQYHRAEKTLDQESAERLTHHHWPGNVRELENLIHREFLLAEGSVLRIDRSALAVDVIQGEACGRKMQPQLELGFRKAKAAAVAEFERDYLVRALADSHGNITLAARIAGKERRSFGRLLKKYGIDSTPYRLLDST